MTNGRAHTHDRQTPLQLAAPHVSLIGIATHRIDDLPRRNAAWEMVASGP